MMRYHLLGILLLSLVFSGCRTTQPCHGAQKKEPNPPIAGGTTAPAASGKILAYSPPPANPTPKQGFLSQSPMMPVAGEVEVKNISLDMKSGTIRYTLAAPALVRVRLGLNAGGPLLRTLVDWEKQGQGQQTLVWDKKDPSGQVDFSSRTDMIVVVSALSPNPKQRVGYNGQIKGLEKSPGLKISVPNATVSAAGFPIMRGVSPLRVDAAAKDKKWLTGIKYEVSVFIDGVFVMEDEEGTSPFTYQLNTKGLNNGPHVITVNMICYTGEVGTTSLMVEIKNGQ